MKRILLVFIMFILVACNPSKFAIQTAIAQTQSAPTSTLYPTNILLPTTTPNPTRISLPTSTSLPTEQPTITASPQVQETKDAILLDIAQMLEESGDTESVTTIRPGQDSLEIELVVKWASRDRQPNASFEVIKLLAIVFGGADERKALNFVTGNPTNFSILLNTYSAGGDYKYSSLTYYDTLVKLNKKQITYDEWVSESGAGFVP